MNGRHLDPLDPRFPVRLTMPASCFWEAARRHPFNAALPALAARARADEARYQERYVTPPPGLLKLARPLPLPDDEDTVDFRITDGDWFPGEDTRVTASLLLGALRPESPWLLERDMRAAGHIGHRAWRAMARWIGGA